MQLLSSGGQLCYNVADIWQISLYHPHVLQVLQQRSKMERSHLFSFQNDTKASLRFTANQN